MGRPRVSARSVCVALTTRGNYAKMKSTLCAASTHPDLDLRVVIGGALLDKSYGDFEAVITGDGFAIDGRLDYAVGDDSLAGIAEAAGKCTLAMAGVIGRLKPDVVVVIADRYEALSIAQAAICMNVHIAHLEGGEVSGSIDERIRHAVSKLAQLHFPANSDAAERLRRLGEPQDRIHVVGTPSLDLLADCDLDDRAAAALVLAREGRGGDIDLDSDYIVISQHPVPTEYDDAARQFAETAKAVCALGLPTIWIMPNDEAGAGRAAETVAKLQADPGAPPVRSIGSLQLADYAVLLRHARCLVGNTSSGIREGAYLGVPVVNLGTRQANRQRGQNVVDVDHDAGAITHAARDQIAHGPYPSDPLYGDGHAGERIVEVLMQTLPSLDKAITY